VGALLGGAAFVDGGQAQVAGKAAGGGTGVHPGELEGHQRKGEVLGPFDEAALFQVETGGGDAAFVVNGEERILGVGPFVAVAHPLGDEPGHGAARNAAGGLDQHRKVVAVGEAPEDLADAIAGQSLQGRDRGIGALHKRCIKKGVQGFADPLNGGNVPKHRVFRNIPFGRAAQAKAVTSPQTIVVLCFCQLDDKG
jgi:hypothetical protein